MGADSIGAVFAVGAPMALLLLIPIAAVLCAGLLVLGFRRGTAVLIVAPLVAAMIIGAAFLALRELPLPIAVRADFTESVDSLVMLLPVLLGLAAVPAVGRGVRAVARAVRRRTVAASENLEVAPAD
ncbi:MAG: hypothetical protein JWL94_106 [Microbacteriaceae bacterium]|nr:hypothetical protein [Microbacteriaceae bacterium]